MFCQRIVSKRLIKNISCILSFPYFQPREHSFFYKWKALWVVKCQYELKEENNILLLKKYKKRVSGFLCRISAKPGVALPGDIYFSYGWFTFLPLSFATPNLPRAISCRSRRNPYPLSFTNLPSSFLGPHTSIGAIFKSTFPVDKLSLSVCGHNV